jgi:hypothetical protein
MDFLRLELLDGRLDFLNGAHVAILILSLPPCNGLFTVQFQPHGKNMHTTRLTYYRGTINSEDAHDVEIVDYH